MPKIAKQVFVNLFFLVVFGDFEIAVENLLELRIIFDGSINVVAFRVLLDGKNDRLVLTELIAGLYGGEHYVCLIMSPESRLVIDRSLNVNQCLPPLYDSAL